MLININSQTGFYANISGSSVNIENMPANQYPFNHRWDDLQGTIHGQTSTGKADLTYEEYRDTGFNIYFFQHNQNDQINIIYQMPHSWDFTSSVVPHFHLIPMANNLTTKNVYFEVSHSWAKIHSEIPTAASWSVYTITMSISNSMQYKHNMFSLNAIDPPSGALGSTILLMKTTRLGLSDSDTYDDSKDHGTSAANLGILYADLHFQKLQAGSIDQFGHVY